MANKNESFADVVKRRKKEERIANSQREFNDLQPYIKSGSDVINKVYGGWNSASDMDSYKSTLDEANKRVADFSRRYGDLYGGLSDVTNNFSSALSSWDDTKNMYSYYKTKDAFDAALNEKKDSRTRLQKYNDEAAEYADLENSNFEDIVENTKQMYKQYGKAGARKWSTDKLDEADYDNQQTGYYILGKYGRDSEQYKDFLTALQYEKDMKAYEEIEKKGRELADSNWGVKAVGALNPFAQTLLQPLMAGQKLIQRGDYNPYKGPAMVSQFGNALSNEVSNNIYEATGSKTAAFLYDSLESGVQSYLGALTFGEAFTPFMGMGAYNEAYASALERGLDKSHAEATALASGFAEALFEYVSIEHFMDLKSPASIKGILKNIAGQSLAEGSEELSTEGANTITDWIINGDKREYNQNKLEYIKRGYTEEEASKMAFKEWMGQMVLSFAGGALTGGVMGGMSSVGQYNSNKQLGADIDKASYSTMMNELGNVNPNAEAFTEYQKLVEQYGEDFSGANTKKDFAKIGANITNATTYAAEQSGEKSNGQDYMGRYGEIATAGNVIANGGTVEKADKTKTTEEKPFENEAITKIYNENLTGDREAYDKNFRLLNLYAQNGKTFEEALADIDTNAISESKASQIYNSILAETKMADAVQTKAVNDTEVKWSQTNKPGSFTAGTMVDGKFQAVKDVNQLHLSKQEMKLAKFFNVFSKLGMDIRVIADDSATSKNGFVTSNDNVVTINLRARYEVTKRSGDERREYVMQTFAHESTHWVENILGDEFETFKTVVKETMGLEWDRAVQRQLGKNKSMKVAESEAVARFCEGMIDDASVIDRLVQTAGESRINRIVNAIKKWFKEIRADIQEFISKVPPSSVEAQYAREMDAEFKILQDMWVDMFQKALVKNQVVFDYSASENTDIKFDDKATIESTEHLIAMHNLTTDQLLKTIKLGGFALPSIAIMKQYMPHTEYGDVTVVFPKGTINPAVNKKNKVYSADAWTPSFPSISKKVSEKTQERIEKKIFDILGGRDAYYALGTANLDYDNMMDKFNRNDNPYDAYGNNDIMKYAFMKDTGKGFDVPTKEKSYSNLISNDSLGAIAKVYAEDLENYRTQGYQWYKDNADKVDIIRLQLNEAYIKENREKLNREGLSNNVIRHYQNMFGTAENGMDFNTFDRNARAMISMNRGIETVTDTEAFREKLSNINEEDYKAWINELFEGIIEKEGIRNNADYYTSSGNRRSWEALHWEVTLENIAKAMLSENATGSDGFFAGNNFFGAAVKTYKSIDEMRKDMARLVTQNEEEREKFRSQYSEELSALGQSIQDGEGFGKLDSALEALVDAIRKYKTVSGIDSYLRREYSFLNLKSDTAQRTYDLFQKIANMPTEYYEAKPMRVVRLDEVSYVVIPNNAPSSLIKALNDSGIAYKTFEAGNDADRVKVVNENASEAEGTLFSDKEDSEGNKLTNETAEFFKDSDIRDKDGKLMPMYHASPKDFTVFDIKKASYAGHFGRGFYFATSPFSQFGNKVYKCYLNIKNPIRYDTGEASFTEDQLRKFITAVAEDEDYGIENYGEGYQIEWLVEDFLGQDNYYILNDINATCIGDFVAAVKLFNKVNGTDYDGIVASTETVAFYPSQIKLTTNQNPTENEDIRYSDKITHPQFADAINDWERFNSELMNKKFLKYASNFSANGDRIILIDNQLIYTDGNEENPGISKVIEFNTNYMDEVERAERIIYQYEKNKQSLNTAYAVIENLCGQGFITEYTNGYYRTDERYDRPAERRKSLSDNYHNQFVQNGGRNTKKSKKSKVVYKIEIRGVDSDGNNLNKWQINKFRNSKVVDASKRLIPLYHGSKNPAFYEFNVEEGIWLTPNRKYALEYSELYDDSEANLDVYDNKRGDRIYKLYANITNPLDIGYINGRLNEEEVRRLSKAIGITNVDDFEVLYGIYEDIKKSTFNTAELWELTKTKEFIDLVKKYGYDGLKAVEGYKEKIDTWCAFKANQVKLTDNKNPSTSTKINFSDKVDGYTEVTPGKLGLTDERIDKLLSGGYYGSTNPEYAQAYMAYMSPEDFLKLTTGKNQRALERIKKWDYSEEEFDMDKMADKWNYQPIQLNIDEETLEVVGHEGRHRMWQLQQMGYNQIPVMLFNSANKYSKQRMDSISLMPQWFQSLDDDMNDSDRVTVNDLIPFSQGNRELIKEKFGSGSNATLFSDKVGADEAELLRENARLTKQNEMLKADMAKLRKKLSLEKKVTKGKVLNDKYINDVAKWLVKKADSNYSVEAVAKELTKIYNRILDEGNDWDTVMGEAYELGNSILAEAKPHEFENAWKRTILDDFRMTKINLTEEQKNALREEYGSHWYQSISGKLKFVKEGGMSTSEAIEYWQNSYGIMRDASDNEVDQIFEILDMEASVSQTKEILEHHIEYQERAALAGEIYNKLWYVPTVTTTADKYDNEIKKLKAEHKKAMAELKDNLTVDTRKLVDDQKLADDIHYGKQLSKADKKYNDLAKRYKQSKDDIEKQRLADQIYYSRIINDVRERQKKAMAEYKQYQKNKALNQKDLAERRRLVNKISDSSKEMAKWINHPDVKKGKLVPDALKKPVSDLLSAIDFSSKRALGMTWGENSGVPTKKDVSFANAMRRMYETVRDIENKKTDDFGLDLPPQFADDWDALSETVRKISEKANGDDGYILNQMTTEELQSLDLMVTAMFKAVKEANRIIIGKNKVHVASIAQDTISLEEKYGAKDVSKYKVWERTKQFFAYDNLLPVYAFKNMGEGAKKVFDEIRNGWCKYAFNIKEIENYVKTGNDGKAIYTGDDVKKWENTTHEFEVLMRDKKGNATGETRKVTLTEAQMMSLYCLSKREQAKSHLFHKGFVVSDINSKDQKKAVIQSDNIPLTVTELEKILAEVESDAKMKMVADKLQEFMNTRCSEWGNEITMARFGITAFGEKNYFPIRVAPTELDADVKDNTKSLYGLLNMSFTKPLVQKASNAILLESIFDVFENHTEEMAKYNSLALPLLNTLKWWNYSEENADETKKSVRGTLKTVYGAQMNSYIYNFLTDINGQQERGRGEDIPKAMLKHYKVAAIGGNLQVALLQPVSYARAAFTVKGKYLATSYNPKDIKHGIEMKNKHSGLALWKDMGFFDVNIGRGLDKLIKQDKTVMDKITDISLVGAEKMDDITWGALWTACEKQTKAEKNLSGEALMEATAELFNETVMRTQVFDSTISRSSNMRSNSFEAQVLTAFMSEPTLGYNTLLDVCSQYALDARKMGRGGAFKKHGKTFAKAAYLYAVSAALESVVRTAWSKIKTPDDDDEDIEEVWKKFFSTFLQNGNPLNNLPIIKDLFDIADGYSPKRMEYEAFSTFQKAYKYYEKMIDEGVVSYKAVYTILQALSQVAGYPVSGTLKSVIDMWNAIVGRMYDDLIVK